MLDLASQVFERLTVLEAAGLSPHGKRLWRCRCSCGTEVLVPTGALRSGNTKSCGCLSRELAAERNRSRRGSPAANRAGLEGQVFGRLTVLGSTGIDARQQQLWDCRCECGNTLQVPTANLRSGNTQSCGCLQRERAREAGLQMRGNLKSGRSNLIGVRFGRLVVKAYHQTRRTPSGYALAYWDCLCDCGKSAVVSTANLRSGEVASCGCGMSRPSGGEGEVAAFVRELDPDVLEDRALDGVRGYRFDVISQRHRLVVEFNGVFWHSLPRVSREYHLNKRLAAEAAGYRMITIWQDEWAQNRPRFEDLLRRCFGVDDVRRIGARQCELVRVSSEETRAFHAAHHVQRAGLWTRLNVGLRLDGELLAVASFRKRVSWHELSRYTVRSGVSIAGGLLKTIRSIGATRVITYTDRDHFDGRVYLASGFERTGTSLQLKYLRGSVRYPRENYMRHKLPALGIELAEGESEREGLARHGIHQCWNSGVDRYELLLP